MNKKEKTRKFAELEKKLIENREKMKKLSTVRNATCDKVAPMGRLFDESMKIWSEILLLRV
jgi:hypothetical protein